MGLRGMEIGGARSRIDSGAGLRSVDRGWDGDAVSVPVGAAVAG